MSKVLERVKRVFQRKPRPQNVRSTRFAFQGKQPSDTIIKPPHISDDDNDDEGDHADSTNFNILEETRSREQQRRNIQSEDNIHTGNPYGSGSAFPPTTIDSSNSTFRANSSDFAHDLPAKSNTTTTMNTNTTSPNPITPAQSGFSFLSQIQNPSSRPPLNPIPPQTSLNGFPPGMNPNQTIQSTSTVSPPIFLPGFPSSNQSAPPAPFPAPNSNQSVGPSSSNNLSTLLAGFSGSTNPPASVLQPPVQNNSSVAIPTPLMNQPNSSNAHFPSSRNHSNGDNISCLELDYPVENVLIDANIPSAVAIKINDAVERDRLGNSYHVHRYTYEPSSQKISLGNNHLVRNLNDNSHHIGTRHIREISLDQHNSAVDDIDYPRRTSRRRRRRHHSEIPLGQYVDQLLHTPGRTVVQRDDFNTLQQLNIPITSALSANQSAFTEPVFYYTARALLDDPMRIAK